MNHASLDNSFQSPNNNDRNVPGGIEATLSVLLLAPERAETYRVIVVIVNNVATIMIIIIIIAKVYVIINCRGDVTSKYTVVYKPSTENTPVAFVFMFDGALRIMRCLINCH